MNVLCATMNLIFEFGVLEKPSAHGDDVQILGGKLSGCPPNAHQMKCKQTRKQQIDEVTSLYLASHLQYSEVRHNYAC